MAKKNLQRLCEFNAFLLTQYDACVDLDDDAYEVAISKTPWSMYLRKMKEGKSMLDIVRGIQPTDLLLDLKKFDEVENDRV